MERTVRFTIALSLATAIAVPGFALAAVLEVVREEPEQRLVILDGLLPLPRRLPVGALHREPLLPRKAG